MNLANVQMPVPCFDRIGSASITSSLSTSTSSSSSSSKHCRIYKPSCSWCCVSNTWGRLVFGPYLVDKKSGRRMESLGFRVRALMMSSQESDNGVVVGGGVIEDLEFKPNFNEYLKALESFKRSVDGKKEEGESRGFSSREHSSDRRGGRKLRRSKRVVVERGNAFELSESDEIKENGLVKSEVHQKVSKVRGSNGELNGRESADDANVKWRTRGTTKDELQLTNRSSTIDIELDEFRLGKVDGIQHDREFGSLNEFRSSDRSMKRRLSNGEQMLDSKKVMERQDLANRMSTGHVRGNAKVDHYAAKGTAHRNGSIIGRNHSFRDIGDDDGSDVERAAFRNFRQLDDPGMKPIVYRREVEERIQKLANSLNGADINMPEWSFSKMIRSARIKYTDHTILRLIQILGKLGNWRCVLQVIEWLQMRERFKSTRIRYVYTTALDVLGKARRPVEALNVFNAMLQQAASYPDLVAYHSIAVTLGQAGYMKELFDVIDTMRSPPRKKFKIGILGKFDPRLEPDIVIYNAVLNACHRRKHWEGAFWVLQQLKEHGIQPSTATYGLIMEVMFACGKYNLVHDFFKKMQKSCIPNALAYKVIVNTLWKEDRVDKAVLAVQEMERRGIVGSAALYYDLARSLCSSGRCEEALQQMEKVCKVATKPLVVTYTGLIQACLDSGNIQNALFIFNDMKRFCCPNLVTCNIMLKAFLDKGMFEEANDFFAKMSEDGDCVGGKSDHNDRVLPDIYTFNTMLDACVAEKRWDDFIYVYGQMLHHGYHFNAKRHLRMILDASRAGKGEPLEMTWNHLAHAGRDPPPPLIKERFCTMLERGNYGCALDCITSNPYGGSKAFSPNAWLYLLKDNASRFEKDTIVNFAYEVKMLISRSDSPNLALQDVLASCNDFLSTNFCTVQHEIPLLR